MTQWMIYYLAIFPFSLSLSRSLSLFLTFTLTLTFTSALLLLLLLLLLITGLLILAGDCLLKKKIVTAASYYCSLLAVEMVEW